MNGLPAGMLLAVFGACLALGLTPLMLRVAPPALVRTNFRGRHVPAVLGGPLAVAGTVGAGLAWIVTDVRPAVALAGGGLIAIMSGAGLVDDLRGDEASRGFKGHLKALGERRVTGGLVKIAAGGIGGLLAALLTTSGLIAVLMVGAIVALSANFVNLLDRAPGRAGKVTLILACIPLGLGLEGWSLTAAAFLGGLLVALVWDLRESGMLGDAGANAAGALVGLGLALATEGAPRAVTLILLLAVNAASERWSYSELIARTKVLRAMDRWGRAKT